MKNKIKSLIYVVSAVVLTAPALAMAQLQAPQGTNLPNSSVTDIITRAMNWLLWLVGILGVIGFVIAGILYLTSAGDETRIEKAKRAMLYAIVGVVVAMAGLVALSFAQSFLGAQQY